MQRSLSAILCQSFSTGYQIRTIKEEDVFYDDEENGVLGGGFDGVIGLGGIRKIKIKPPLFISSSLLS